MRQYPSAYLLLLASLVLVLEAAVAMSQDQPAGTRDPKAIAAELRAGVGRLESLHVKTTLHSEPVSEGGEELWVNFGATTLDEYAFTRDGCRFRLRRRWQSEFGHKPEDRPWMEDRVAYDGEILRSVMTVSNPPQPPHTESANMVYENKSALLAQANIYDEATGCLFFENDYLDVWRYQRKRLGSGDKLSAYKAQNPFPILKALETGHYQIRQKGSKIDSIECVVLESPGFDTLWLAPAMKFAIVRREISWAPGMPLMMRFANGEFAQVSEGLWLPRRVTRELYNLPKDGTAAESRILLRNNLTVTQLIANDVPRSLFKVEFPSGAMVVDFTKLKDKNQKYVGITYTIGANPTATQAALDRALSVTASHMGAKVEGQSPSHANSARMRYLVLSVVLLFAIAAAAYAYGRWRARVVAARDPGDTSQDAPR
jgi:hypothetical protein